MRKRYKKKNRSCALCKPHKMKWEKRWKFKDLLLLEEFEKYQNKWIALTDDDKVISSGIILDTVLKEAKGKGYNNPVTAKIPDLKF